MGCVGLRSDLMRAATVEWGRCGRDWSANATCKVPKAFASVAREGHRCDCELAAHSRVTPAQQALAAGGLGLLKGRGCSARGSLALTTIVLAALFWHPGACFRGWMGRS